MKDWLFYVPFWFAAFVFGHLPATAVRWIGEAAGGLDGRIRKDKRVLLSKHMRRVLGPDAPEGDVQAEVDEMFRSYGRYWAETFWFRPHHKQRIADSVERVNFEPVLAAKRAGRPIVFAVPHVGNWEIAGLIADDLDLNLMAVAEDLPNPKITDWFLNVRAEFGFEIVLTTDPRRRSKLVKRLKEGGAIALLADRDVAGTGVSVDFFGEPAMIPAGPAALADLTGAALIPVVVYVKEGVGYTIVVGEEIQIPHQEVRSDRIHAGSQLVARALEDMIKERPAQWHLFQPNWLSDTVDAEGSGA